MGSSAGCGRGNDRVESPPVTPITAGAGEDAAAPPPSTWSRYDDHGRLRVDDEHDLFVGLLRRNRPADQIAPSEYCLDDGKLWRGSDYRLGRINVFGVAAGEIQTGGDPVAVYAVRRPSLDAALVEVGPCPEGYGAEADRIQMRSDWVCDEGGFRTSHEKLATVPYLEASAVEVVRLHRIVDQSDTTTRIELHNPFAVALEPIALRLHYEGGPGKPMPTFVAVDPPRLPAGGSAVIEVARTPSGEPVGDRSKRQDRLFGLELRGELGRLHLDVELPVD